jgi:hypothetical protein
MGIVRFWGSSNYSLGYDRGVVDWRSICGRTCCINWGSDLDESD